LASLLAVIRSAGLSVLTALGSPVDLQATHCQEIDHASPDRCPTIEESVFEPARSIDAEVQTEHLDVFDRPADSGFITGRVHRGDHVFIRPGHTTGTGWVAIRPPSTAIFWIEQSSLEHEDVLADAGEQDRSVFAWVSRPEASIRSGHPQAKLPGPPVGTLPKGTLVQLIDRPPLRIGQGPRSSFWLAIVPPAGRLSYVRASGVRWLKPASSVTSVAEIRVSYDELMPPGQAAKPQSNSRAPSSSSWPPGTDAELQRIDGVYQVIISSQPIEKWRFETIRAGYLGLLKRAGDQRDLEDALRSRLSRLTQHEQAARAARTIESILVQSHRRDIEVAAVRKELSRLERTRARSYDAVGFIQPSARKVDGHKVFALIGGQGSTIAYLDIPPGLDPEPLLARRIGVRGQAHYSEDLGTRLITVRDIENLETR
jgi:hypothetical protein